MIARTKAKSRRTVEQEYAGDLTLPHPHTPDLARKGWPPRIIRAILRIQRMIEVMPYISEHLTSLRQEIADLRNLNARTMGKAGHNELDQTVLELRSNRLREIKKELAKMLDRPDDPKVWWERSRRHLVA